MADTEQRVSLEDNEQVGGEEAPPSKENAGEEAAKADQPKKTRDGILLSSYGNSAGDRISSTLSPVGKPIGKGLETVAAPVGGLVEPLVGGVMKGASAWGDALGTGSGNMEHKNAAEEEERRRPLGGQEQTAENPLGL